MKPFTTAAFVILLAAGLAHAWRIAAGFDVIIGGHAIPAWASIIAAVVAIAVALMMRREARS